MALHYAAEVGEKDAFLDVMSYAGEWFEPNAAGQLPMDLITSPELQYWKDPSNFVRRERADAEAARGQAALERARLRVQLQQQTMHEDGNTRHVKKGLKKNAAENATQRGPPTADAVAMAERAEQELLAMLESEGTAGKGKKSGKNAEAAKKKGGKGSK